MALEAERGGSLFLLVQGGRLRRRLTLALGVIMKIPRVLIRVVVLLSLAVPTLCNAGRPMIEDVSLSDLVRTSSVIAAVTMAAPASTLPDKHGCRITIWHLTVASILKNDTKSKITVGKDINVGADEIALTDCRLRGLPGMLSGASFLAKRYKPSITKPPEHGQFLVFLKPSDTDYYLVVSSAFESVFKKPKVVNLLKHMHHDAQPIAPADRHPATRAVGG
jgi:hypothetical protein